MSSTRYLEQHVQTTNAQMTSTLMELSAATTALTAQTTVLSTQVATITTELAGVAQLLKGLRDKVDNIETNCAAPISKQPRIDTAAAAAGC